MSGRQENCCSLNGLSQQDRIIGECELWYTKVQTLAVSYPHPLRLSCFQKFEPNKLLSTHFPALGIPL